MKRLKICGIYRIVHTATGRCYVGLSIDIFSRWKAHKCDVGRTDYRIHRAMAKHGLSAFSFEVLEECAADLLGEREKFWIKELNAYGAGFNMNEGGDSPAVTDERKKKVSESLKGVKKTPEHNAKVSAANKGQVVTDAQRALFSIAAKARWDDPIRRAALMASRSKKRICSLETRSKIAAAQSRYQALPGVKAKLSETMKAALAPSDVRAKISASASKTMQDPDVRRRIGIGVSMSWKTKKELST